MHPPPKKYEINLYKLIYLEKMDLGSQSFFFHRLSYIKLDFLIFIFPLQFVQCKLQVLKNEYVNSTTEERGLGSLIFFM